MQIYGISTCDTVRKARKALEAAGHAVSFQDVRAEPLMPGQIEAFLGAFGDRLVNRASTSWRALSEAERSQPAALLLAAHPTLMKRPVIVEGEKMTLGWDKAAQAVWI